jgi:hypothetical protein
VHGELHALLRLVEHLGYDTDGAHPEGRKLVFLGDLVDRGPDSLEVVRRVRSWMRAGNAQCVVGNHELNLVLGKRRPGNEWFYGEQQHLRDSTVRIEQCVVGDDERVELLLFIQQLPLALEREDLRVVHACWDATAIATLREERRGIADLFFSKETDITKAVMVDGDAPGSLVADLARQNDNPVTALTSGLERETAEPFRAGGQMRKSERVSWWTNYQDPQTVVFGHYWRALDSHHRPVKRGPDLFGEVDWKAPLGPRANAWCVDYSVGARNVARAMGGSDAPDALMALRHPEMELIDDRGGVHRQS